MWPYTLPEWDGQQNVYSVIPGLVGGYQWLVVRMSVASSTGVGRCAILTNRDNKTIRVVGEEVVQDVELTEELTAAMRQYIVNNGWTRTGGSLNTPIPFDLVRYRLPQP